jgi:predicted AlkP superfamily phosphohydrolase/phosphomutase
MDDLLLLLKKELIQLECYLSVSKRLIYEDIYAFGEILGERDEQIKVYQQILSDITTALNRLPGNTSEKRAVRAVIESNATDLERAAYPDIAVLISEINSVIADIRTTDAAALARANAMRSDILSHIESGEKSNRVANYIKQTNFDPTRGQKMNMKS